MSVSFTNTAPPPVTRKQRWWWEALADFYMSNPTATDKEAALYFSRHESTISIIRRTDGFKAMMAQRRQDFRENMDAALAQKVTGVAYSAFDAVLEKLQKKRDNLPIQELTEVIKTVSQFTGGGRNGSGVTVNVNSAPVQQVVVPVGIDDLTAAQAALRAHQRTLASPPPLIEATAVVEETKSDVADPAVDLLSDPA